MACIMCLHIFREEDASPSIPVDDELISDVLPSMEVKLSVQPEVCPECDDKFHQFRNFKDRCDKTENKIHYQQFGKDIKPQIIKDAHNKLSDILNNGNTGADFQNSCRICLMDLKCDEYYLLEGTSTYTGLINSLIPEMDLKLTELPKICKECANHAEEFYSFQQTYLHIQSILQDHLSDKEALSKIDLIDIAENVQFESSLEPMDDILIQMTKLHQEQLDDRSLISNAVKGCYNNEMLFGKINRGNRRRGDISINCDFCNFTTKYRDYLKKHIQLKHDGNSSSLSCENCDFKTKDKHYLTRHIKEKHDSLGWLTCKFCDYQTKKRYTLLQHMSHMHDKNREIFKCPKCSFETKYKSSLTQHIKTKHIKPEEFFKCNECKYQTSQKRYLVCHFKETHRRMIVLHKCSFCDHNSKSGLLLKRHIKIKHTEDIEIHHCPYCEHKTKFSHHLKQHIKTLHDVNSTVFSCHLCSFTTKNKHSLKRHHKEKHEENHTTFQCSHCQFVTKYSTYLKKHIKINHGQSVYYNCKHCDFKSHYTSSLKKHVMVKHRHDTEILKDGDKGNNFINEVLIKVEFEEHDLPENVEDEYKNDVDYNK